METGERIPERIREKAEELAGYLVGNDTPTEAAIVAVARALLAERDRAARIADHLAEAAEIQSSKFDRNSLDFQRWAEGCRNVARDIRA